MRARTCATVPLTVNTLISNAKKVVQRRDRSAHAAYSGTHGSTYAQCAASTAAWGLPWRQTGPAWPPETCPGTQLTAAATLRVRLRAVLRPTGRSMNMCGAAHRLPKGTVSECASVARATHQPLPRTHAQHAHLPRAAHHGLAIRVHAGCLVAAAWHVDALRVGHDAAVGHGQRDARLRARATRRA